MTKHIKVLLGIPQCSSTKRLREICGTYWLPSVMLKKRMQTYLKETDTIVRRPTSLPDWCATVERSRPAHEVFQDFLGGYLAKFADSPIRDRHHTEPCPLCHTPAGFSPSHLLHCKHTPLPRQHGLTRANFDSKIKFWHLQFLRESFDKRDDRHQPGSPLPKPEPCTQSMEGHPRGTSGLHHEAAS